MSAHSFEDEPERRDGDSGGEQEHPEQGAAAHRKGKRKKNQRSFWKELPILIVVALVLAFLIQQFLARVYMIPSGSMEDTLRIGDRILVDKITYDFSDPVPGDVVVFKGPPSWTKNDVPTQDSSNGFVEFLQSVGSVFGLAPPDEKDFVKRIVATGGQTVSCCDDQNRVMVDGQPLREPYIHWPAGRAHTQQPFDPVTVPGGSVFVMGDNRTNSCDSRCQGGGGVPGTVPVENIIGEARLIVLPPSHWSTIDDPNPQESGAVALPAPGWQQGVPLGVGVLAAWPTVAAGRRVGPGLRRAVGRR